MSRVLKPATVPQWSARDRLLLAELVVKCGNQNWPQVSKHMKQQTTSVQLDDYYSTRNCALQFSSFLENLESTGDSPQRRTKRNEPASMSDESKELQIEADLREAFVKALEGMIAEDRVKYRALLDELALMESGKMSIEEMTRIVSEDANSRKQLADLITARNTDREARLQKSRSSRRSSTASVPSSPAPAHTPATPVTPTSTTPLAAVVTAPATKKVEEVKAEATPAETKPAATTSSDAMDTSTQPAPASPARSAKSEADPSTPPTRTTRTKRARVEDSPEPERTSTRHKKARIKEEVVDTRRTRGSRAASPAPSVEEKTPRTSRRKEPSHLRSEATKSTRGKGKGKGKGRGRKMDTESVASSARSSPAPPMSPMSNFSSPSESSEDEGHEYEFEEDIEMSNARQRKVWKASIMTVWNQIAGLKDANLFRHPVTNDVAAGYSDVVFRPMDLGTIKKRIDNGEISTTKMFEHDILLMLSNALMYNDTSHFVYEAALEMRKESVAAIENYKDTMRSTMPEDRVKGRARRRDAKEQSKPVEVGPEDSRPKRRRQD